MLNGVSDDYFPDITGPSGAVSTASLPFDFC